MGVFPFRWGAFLGSLSVQGVLPINILELQAVHLVLVCWTSQLHGFPVRVQSDNAMATEYHPSGWQEEAGCRD